MLIDQAETPSFFLDDELKNRFPGCSYSIIIGDITNEEKMEQVFIQFRPEIVFHAAAYKHVPVMEGQPHEAFRVNVGGTKVMTDLAIKYKTEKFILVSSDKAVNPTNVMGATKKICELLVQAQTRRTDNRTQFVTTRFGNVLGSSGSVLPIFIKQIAEGGPVTITHPDIVRFFMTIPEACQLVLEASFIGKGGEIYIFDMGNPVRILELAEKMIHLSGLEPYEDIEIKFTGLRPGEKLYEELVSDSELQLPTHHPKISIVQADGCNYKIVPLKIDKILASLYNLSEKEIIEEMQEIVPSYTTKYEITL